MKSLFASNVLELLTVLFLAKNESVHQSEIAAQSGVRLIQAQRALRRISEAGLIHEIAKGNMIYYKLNKHHPAYADLKNMLYKTVLIAEPLKEAFEQGSKEVRQAFIYGSFASGTETAESDIDLFVISKIRLKKLSIILSPIAKQLHREINPVVYTKEEFIKKVKSKDHFITSVLDSKRLWVVGDENEFRAMVK